MKGGFRQGSGRPKKNEKDKVKYITKTIKFKESEKDLLNFIEKYNGNNFSERLKNIIKKVYLFEKK